MLTRRGLMAGLLAGMAGPALGAAPLTSPRPPKRGQGFVAQAVDPAAELVNAARLDGKTSFAVADAATGQLLESREPALPQPPASTAKALTALYALETLGPDYRFATRVVATGPIHNGRLEGDLILVGGGDPTLDTDHLGAMAAELKQMGLREVGGHFRIWSKGLPEQHEIDREQPDHVGYNPAISGLNLNYNRVHFEWKKSGSGFAVTMEARGARFSPGVEIASMEVIDRPGPVYTYEQVQGRDIWTVARGALGNGGARWLPIRRPAAYAGEVFRQLVAEQGILMLGEMMEAESDKGSVLVEHRSPPLLAILEDMLKYSTNVTAELCGLTATAARQGRPASLRDSAQAMSAWLKEKGMASADFEDHSGLGDDSRISAADMTRAMVVLGPQGPLRPILKDFRLEEGDPGQVDAKTGTLNFVSALTGYLEGPGGNLLAFAIFCADTERRDALTVAQRERPEGGRAWIGRSRTLQRRLLARWARVYTG